MRYVLIVLALCQTLVSSTAAQTVAAQDFEKFLDAVDSAQVKLQNGDPGPFKALWSQRSDVTLAGGFGGPVSVGWKEISDRLDAVGRQFSNGRHHASRLAASSSGDFGYVVQLEHIDFRVPGQTTDSSRDYRVTMVFRREAAGWRIVHRQADTQLVTAMPR